jgi:hypothetical protein
MQHLDLGAARMSCRFWWKILFQRTRPVTFGILGVRSGLERI